MKPTRIQEIILDFNDRNYPSKQGIGKICVQEKTVKTNALETPAKKAAGCKFDLCNFITGVRHPSTHYAKWASLQVTKIQ